MKKRINVYLLMAGSSIRMDLGYNKVRYEINHYPLFRYSLDTFLKLPNHIDMNTFDFHFYLVLSLNDLEDITDDITTNYPNESIQLIIGGKTRHDSVINALKTAINTDYVIFHDCARPLCNINDIISLIKEVSKYSNKTCGSLYHNLTDTIKLIDEAKIQTINRDKLIGVSTPQMFTSDLINDIKASNDLTDELQIFETNKKVKTILQKETTPNIKATTKDDLIYIEYLLTKDKEYKIGHSLDYHPFIKDRLLILGGVVIPYEFGLAAHSDGDVLYHSVTEAILGALSLPDIGTIYPDNDEKYLNINSEYFIKDIYHKLLENNYVIANLDIMIYIESPKLQPYKPQMVINLQRLLHCNKISVKATTMEKQGVIGTKQGISVETVVLIQKQV